MIFCWLRIFETFFLNPLQIGSLLHIILPLGVSTLSLYIGKSQFTRKVVIDLRSAVFLNSITVLKTEKGTSIDQLTVNRVCESAMEFQNTIDTTADDESNAVDVQENSAPSTSSSDAEIIDDDDDDDDENEDKEDNDNDKTNLKDKAPLSPPPSLSPQQDNSSTVISDLQSQIQQLQSRLDITTNNAMTLRSVHEKLLNDTALPEGWLDGDNEEDPWDGFELNTSGESGLASNFFNTTSTTSTNSITLSNTARAISSNPYHVLARTRYEVAEAIASLHRVNLQSLVQVCQGSSLNVLAPEIEAMKAVLSLLEKQNTLIVETENHIKEEEEHLEKMKKEKEQVEERLKSTKENVGKRKEEDKERKRKDEVEVILQNIIEKLIQKHEMEQHVVSRMKRLHEHGIEQQAQKEEEMKKKKEKEQQVQATLKREKMLLDESTSLQDKVKRLAAEMEETEDKFEQRRKQLIKEERVIHGWRRLISMTRLKSKLSERRENDLEEMRISHVKDRHEQVLELESRLRSEFEEQKEKERVNVEGKETGKEEEEEEEKDEEQSLASKKLQKELDRARKNITQLKKEMEDVRFEKDAEHADLVRKIREQRGSSSKKKHKSIVKASPKSPFSVPPPPSFVEQQQQQQQQPPPFHATATRTLDLEHNVRKMKLKMAKSERELSTERARSQVLSLEITKLTNFQQKAAKVREMSIVESSVVHKLEHALEVLKDDVKILKEENNQLRQTTNNTTRGTGTCSTKKQPTCCKALRDDEENQNDNEWDISVANSAKTFLPKMDQDHRARLEAAYKRLRERKENLSNTL
jgi:hypothetical protein